MLSNAMESSKDCLEKICLFFFFLVFQVENNISFFIHHIEWLIGENCSTLKLKDTVKFNDKNLLILLKIASALFQRTYSYFN